MLKESISMSKDNILASKMRSFLTTLGIIIGVAVIIALITVVESVTDDMMNRFTQMGTGKLSISITGTPLKSGLREADLEKIEQIEFVTGTSANIKTTANVKHGAYWSEDVDVEGQSAAYFDRNADTVAVGRDLNILDMQSNNRVGVIDKVLSDKLFFGENPIGQKIFVDGYEYTVVGLLTEDETMDLMSQISGSGDNGRMIIPYTTAMKLAGTSSITSVEVYVDQTTEMDGVIDAIETVLNDAFNHKDNAFRVINMQSLLETMNIMKSMMMTLLAGIASIALVVGGIGIMNMMLVSVTERTTEIGLRKALGAKPGQIQLQFLIESIMLSIIGGLLGVAVGLSVCYILCNALGTSFVISTWSIALGVGFSAAVGIIFGWAPARKASILNPIDALRSV